MQAEEPETETKAEINDKESLGKLTVNGDFALQCKLPEGYKLQVVNVKNTKVVASVLPQDNTRPVMYLTIAFDELHADVARFNDLPEQEVRILEDSFTNEGNVYTMKGAWAYTDAAGNASLYDYATELFQWVEGWPGAQ